MKLIVDSHALILIIAQALAAKLLIISHDAVFDSYGIQRIG